MNMRGPLAGAIVAGSVAFAGASSWAQDQSGRPAAPAGPAASEGRPQSSFVAQAQPEKAALMLVIAHPDDEAYFPGLIPYLCQVRKLPIVVIVMTSGEAGLNPPGDRRIREDEMRRACRIYGMPNEPIFARFADGAFLGTLEDNWKLWGGEQKGAEYLVQQIRRYRPDVVVTHALDGEYGHPNHVGCALSVTKAFAGASDVTAFPATPGSAPPWTPRKLYVHRWPTRPMAHRWDIPIPDLGGRTCLEVGIEGGRQHVSQGYANKDFSELDADKATSFGLYSTNVGPDEKGGGFFENVDLSPYGRPAKLPGTSQQ